LCSAIVTKFRIFVFEEFSAIRAVFCQNLSHW
jgi:hypothetical protein